MSALVIDASITLSWLLPDEASGLAIAVRNDDLLKAEVTWVPTHWRLEVCNSLWMAERRKRLDAIGVAQAAELFLKIPVSTDPDTNDRAGRETLALARQHALSVYDAAYLELVLRRGAILASLDVPLRLVAKKLGVSLLPTKLPEES
jgi:predicted nucleic acid-binding protein